jgi:hypothetical protein
MNLFKFFARFFSFFHLSIVDGEVGTEQDQPNPHLNPRNAAMAHSQQAADLSDFDEDTGQITPRTAEAEVQKVVEEEAKDPPAVVTSQAEQTAPRMATIVVDGQAIEVEEARLIEAGKRTLQKESAADRRLQAAENAKRQAEALLEQAQRLSGDGQSQTPSQDASFPAQQATNGFDPAMLDTALDQKLYIRDAQKALESFTKEFPEIASNPDLMSIAAVREDKRLKAATALGESFGDPSVHYRAHGEAIRSLLKQHAPVATAEPTDKAERKRSITAVSAVNAKPPAPQDKKPMSVSEVIEQQRLARRQGRQLNTH